MGTNGGVGHTIFVDGFMAGLWWQRDGRQGRVVEPDVFVKLTRSQRAELDEEIARVETLLAS
jgi:hypothetical protein